MSIKKSILTRIRIAFVLVVAGAGLIIAKALTIQVAEGEKWQRIAEEYGLQYIKVDATRGNIVSDNGNLLATSLPFYKLAIDPTIASNEDFEANIDTLSHLLANYFKERSAASYDSLLREERLQNRQYKVLSKKLVSHQDKLILSKWPLFNLGRTQGGVIFEKAEQRFRPYESLARRTIGFTYESDGDDLTGRGLEFSFNNELAGEQGEALYQRISGGRWKPLADDASQIRPKNGYDIQTTLHIDLQAFANKALENGLTKHQADYGCAIVMEVETGEIKAMVNLGRTNDGHYIENYNYAVGSQGVAEPGSTFKLASIMAVLEEADITITDTINTTENAEYMFYDECVMRDATMYGYGMLSVREVFEKSSNIGISKLAFRHFNENPSRFINHLENFGLLSPLNFQMKGEGKPMVSKPGTDVWSGCSIPWIAIGYEVKISPLQLLAFYNAVANNGYFVQPMIVKQIMEGNRTVKAFTKQVRKKPICSEGTLFTVKGLLEGVVDRGTAQNLRDTPYKIAGKTGTTHKLRGGAYVNDYYTSFAGYFPAENPKYSCIVVIDSPKGDDKYGGKVAAPIFKEIADWIYIKALDRPLEKDPLFTESLPVIRNGHYTDLELLSGRFDLKTLPLNTEEWVKTSVSGDTIKWINNYMVDSRVPDVRGMTLRDAIFLLENQGLQVKATGKGRVVQQSLSPGTSIKRGNRIFISLG